MAFINDPGATVERYLPGGAPAASPTATGPLRTVNPTALQDPPPPGDITVGSGSTPDYNSLIQGDPGYLAAANQAQQAKAAAAAQRTAALRALAIKYGGLPSGFKDQFGDLDQATLDQANANQFSEKANIKRNYDQGIEGFKRALAARGLLQSGELGYGLDQADTARGQQEYDAGNQFGDQFQSAINGYTGAVNDSNSSLASAISGAESNVYSNPANRPTAPGVAHMDAGSVEQYGFPVYTDPTTGKRYKVDGSEFIDPSGASASASPGGAYVNDPGFQQAVAQPAPQINSGLIDALKAMGLF